MKIDLTKKYIGHSLSSCVSFIVDGRMPLENVLYIETGTKIASFSDMLEVIEQYNECAWYDLDRQRCLETVEYFLFRGLIHQCRLINGEIKTIPDEGVWVEATPRQILLTDECEILHPTVTYENIEQVIDFHQSEGFDDEDGMPDFRDAFSDETMEVMLKWIKDLFNGEPAFETIGEVTLNCGEYKEDN